MSRSAIRPLDYGLSLERFLYSIWLLVAVAVELVKPALVEVV
jgi:hypothetical protein